MIKKVLWTGAGLLVLVGVISTAKHFQNSYQQAQQAKLTLPPPMVNTVMSQSQNWHPNFISVGTLSAIQGTAIQTQAAGRIIEIDFKSGQLVKQGDLLIKLDSDPIQAQIAKATTEVRLAMIQEKRQEALIKTQATTQSTLDSAIEALKASQATLKQAQAELAYTEIRAPLDGTLGLNTLSLGQYLPIGSTVVDIQSINPIRVNYPVPDKQIPNIKPGLEVDLTTAAYPKQIFKGTVSALHSKIDSTSKSLEAEALIQNTDTAHLLLPGAFVMVTTILATQNSVVTIPETALVNQIYGSFAYEIIQNKNAYALHEVNLTLGDTRNGQTQILSGLKANIQIVNFPQFNLQNGAAVRIDNSNGQNNQND